MQFDVVGIGNPLLDIVSNVEYSFLENNNYKKGTMHLVDANTQADIINQLSNITHSAGGSVANALAAVAALGGNALFIGVIGNDSDGEKYELLTKKAGIISSLKKANAKQGSSLSLITPDTERTMLTHLGACLYLTKDHIDLEEIKRGKILLIEAYQLDGEKQYEAALHAMSFAKKEGILIAIDLADPALIGRHTEKINMLIKDYSDIIFVNETEAKAVTGKEPLEAVKELKENCKIAVVKIGSEGSYIFADKLYKIEPVKVNAINSTGAGDSYAGSFLCCYAKGYSIEECGKVASYVASKVVSSNASRIEEKLNISEILN